MIVFAVELYESKIKKFLQEKLFFGNEPSLDLIAILIVYFVQGILGLARLAISFFLKDELGLSPAQMGALLGIAALPWVIKPLFGFLSDGLPLFGYRRRPYLVLSGLMGTIAWLSLAKLVDTALAATIAILLSSISVAISDVIVDSLVVERARKESLTQSGSLQSLTWGASAMGGLITAYLSGWLLEQLGTRTVFAITATFPLLVCVVAWLISEEPVGDSPKNVSAAEKLTSDHGQDSNLNTVKNQIKQLRGAISQKAIWLPTAFIFIWQATPTADSAFFYFTTNELGFEAEFLGRVRLVTSIASLLGIWLFQRFLKKIPFRTIMGWTTLLSSLLGMTTLLLVTHANRSLGIDDHWFSLGDSLILTVMGQIAFMPILVLSARLCPAGVEATLFALLMSIWNLSGLLSHELGALLTHYLGITDTNFDKMWLLVVITNTSSLLPLPFLGWLPAGDPKATIESEVNHRSLPRAEVFEHHSSGSLSEQPFLPDLMPEFVRNSVSPNPVEEAAD